ncbi:DUF4092 domain-containing protein [Escherichia coli]|uniref:DUF4092 domain-containing protein n=1 Tax=Escherichia coli TaxID=562 RepID=UPI00063D32EB|nr:DUF4092 domain-containing protein [Escherichia coli]EFE8622126.1 DUF4092 domain-containing protein [Escherichia coli O103]EFB3703535.1 DUF4092 domain-containing protein [Escherichia coli]KLG40382.1 hypothetical protein WQ92_18325 [Escherichia coli]MDI0521736.1 DUF4092 domain-containing protein [Escherichia coli]MDI0541085.1 DUF4092 domain-containing protein [Escherichia coli]
MNKKFKYKKSLLAAILSATLLAGCDGGGSGSSSDTPPVDSGTGSLPEVKPDPTPNPEPTPEPTPDPEPTPEPTPDPEPTPEPEPEPVPTKTGYLTLGGSLRVTGDITCNDESSDGFTFTPGDKVTCVAGNNTTIATFDTQSEAARSLRAVEKVSFSLEDAQELAGSDNKKSNALSLVTSMNSCPANTEQVCLEFSSVIESKRFDSLYKQIDLAPEEFKKLVNEEVENNAATDKAPSTHTSPVVPVTTPGTKPDLNASFVSANAEQFYQYQPSEIILSEGRLVDSQGYGVAGVNYYTNSGRGVTGENGEFSFSWGETISFGIDTFELGSVRGNKSTIALTELGDEVRGANIDQLIHRYSTTGQNNTRVVPDDVRKVFAEYPNVINEIINLSLSNGATLDEGEQVVNLPNEFIEQFKTGQAKEIDTAICAKTDGCNEARWFSLTTRNVNDGQIQGVINKLWGVDTNYKSVSKFHVFHDSTNFYGSTGNARGQAVVNISNAAFPILMARNDKNYWLAFGEKRAWDKNELAYITEAPSIVRPENVTRETATFNLPFISLGQVGDGKLMVIGNPHYNSTTLPTTPLNDWLIWHEVGHNAAETPLTVPGATEVANNVLALYMQDRYLGKMNRVADDITVAPEYLEESNGQAWARGGAGDRLLMYAQLKEWAEKNFDIKKWYPEGSLPAFYSEREGMKGWNLFQLMHRKARGDEVGKTKFGERNYCAESNGNAADTLMLCASWVAQTDLSEFFKKWNPGANAYQLPGASEMSFEGGVGQSAYNTLASLKLPKPEQGPETINQVTEHKMSVE